MPKAKEEAVCCNGQERGLWTQTAWVQNHMCQVLRTVPGT